MSSATFFRIVATKRREEKYRRGGHPETPMPLTPWHRTLRSRNYLPKTRHDHGHPCDSRQVLGLADEFRLRVSRKADTAQSIDAKTVRQATIAGLIGFFKLNQLIRPNANAANPYGTETISSRPLKIRAVRQVPKITPITPARPNPMSVRRFEIH
jgi:hypothetical protein